MHFAEQGSLKNASAPSVRSLLLSASVINSTVRLIHANLSSFPVSTHTLHITLLSHYMHSIVPEQKKENQGNEMGSRKENEQW